MPETSSTVSLVACKMLTRSAFLHCLLYGVVHNVALKHGNRQNNCVRKPRGGCLSVVMPANADVLDAHLFPVAK